MSFISRFGFVAVVAVLVARWGPGGVAHGPYEVGDAGEIERVRQHLEGAETMLLGRDLSALTIAQRVARNRRIAELRAYRERGHFPHNHRLRGRTPVFVDEHGTRCAMAYLIERSGGSELVSRIARTRNLARIRDLAGDPALVGWLGENGLTLAEAARIQPEYGDGVEEKDYRGIQLAIVSASAGLSLYGVTLNRSVADTPQSRNRRGLAGLACGMQGGVIGTLFLASGDATARGVGLCGAAMGLVSIGLGIHQLNVRRPSAESVTTRTVAPAAWRDADGTQRVALVMQF